MNVEQPDPETQRSDRPEAGENTPGHLPDSEKPTPVSSEEQAAEMDYEGDTPN